MLGRIIPISKVAKKVLCLILFLSFNLPTGKKVYPAKDTSSYIALKASSLTGGSINISHVLI